MTFISTYPPFDAAFDINYRRRALIHYIRYLTPVIIIVICYIYEHTDRQEHARNKRKESDEFR